MDNILYKNKYRIRTTRLKYWDYSKNGTYYVTICTMDRECVFGNIINGNMQLSEIGEIASNEWIKTEQIRKYVQLDEFIVMPNHIHGIVIIENRGIAVVETPRRGVSTNEHWKPNSLGSIICQFKSITTKRIRSIGFHNFQWQSRFYEHIIRNENELNCIREYIINNPSLWELNIEKSELKIKEPSNSSFLILNYLN